MVSLILFTAIALTGVGALGAKLMDRRRAKTEVQAKLSRARSNVFYTAAKGREWNPFQKHPPNAPCICESGRKWKRCHGPQISATVTKEDAVIARRYLKAKGYL